MDRCDWLHRLEDPEWVHWRPYHRVAAAFEGGRRTAWSLNLLADLCDRCECPGRPERLPSCPDTLRRHVDALAGPRGRQSHGRAIRIIRAMLAVDGACQHLLDHLPRHRRREPANRIRRQLRVVEDDALPRNAGRPCVARLFREIMDHEASAH